MHKQVLLSLGLVLLWSDVAGGQNWGTLYNERNERVGEIRKNDNDTFDLYGRKGERRAWGRRRGNYIEFFGKEGQRLPLEIRINKPEHTPSYGRPNRD